MQAATQPAAAQAAPQATAKPAAAQAATNAANAQQATQAATQPATQAAAANAANTAATNTSVAGQYKINLNNLSLKKEQENGNVKIMQKRLYDLGYITDASNVTGYYGDVSVKAVKDFQQANGITANGVATHATLVKLFDKTAKKAA